MKRIISYLCCVVILLFSVLVIGCNGCSSCKGCGKEEPRSKYDITCSLEENVLTATQDFTFYNQYETSFTYLKFNLFANAYRQGAKRSPVLSQHLSLSYPDGINYGNVEILSVTQDGENLEYSICGEDQNILQVKLKSEVFPEEYAQITIDFKVVIARVVSRLGINEKTVNLANFYPILCAYDNGFYECVYYGIGDPFYSECADYNIKITTDKDYVVASGGEKISSQEQNRKRTTTYNLKNARSLALVLSKEFKTQSAKVNDTTITYFYYQDQTPKESLNHAINSLKLFSQKFGEYPYSTYSVVQTRFVQGGMEFPTITFISDNLEGTAYGEVIVHETAHQWWQSVVGNNEIEYGFLDEGLAEYSVVIYFENYPKYGVTRKELIESAEKTYKVFCSVVDRLDGKVNSTMVRSLKDFSTEYEYVNIAYIKTCIMYETLRKTIGEERFFKGLQKYYEQYSFKNAKPEDIVGVFEKIGAGTNGLFQSFYEGKVVL